MPRIRSNAQLATREARRRLPVSSEPSWLMLETGLSLGYRRSRSGGAWLVRRYDPMRRRHFERRLATADDNQDCDGEGVCSFQQAQRKLLAQSHEQALEASSERYTVADAARDYLTWMRLHRKGAARVEITLKAYVLAHPIAKRRLVDLTAADFTAWVAWALERRHKRARKDIPDNETESERTERLRRRRATVNNAISSLKATLNYAANNGAAANSDSWRRLKKFRGADAARQRWLTLTEATRLLNAAEPHLRALIAAALHSGARLGELLRLSARDFDRVGASIFIADSKNGRPRFVPLTDVGVKLFEALAAGKPEGALLFRRPDGSAWHRAAISRAMSAACSAAKIQPAPFHSMRHSYASHLVQAGVPPLFVSAALGHSDVRMVAKHYGHLAPSVVASAIRGALPSFGPVPQSAATDIRAHKKA